MKEKTIYDMVVLVAIAAAFANRQNTNGKIATKE